MDCSLTVLRGLVRFQVLLRLRCESIAAEASVP
jgi:hypothetical protein